MSNIFYASVNTSNTATSANSSDDDGLDDLFVDASNLPDFSNNDAVPAVVINNTNSSVDSNTTDGLSLVTLRIPVIDRDFILTATVDAHGDSCFAAQLGTISQPLGTVGPIEFISLAVLLTQDNKLAIRGKALLWGQDVVVTVQPAKKSEITKSPETKPKEEPKPVNKSAKTEKTIEIYEIDLILSFGNSFQLNLVDGHPLGIKSITLGLNGKNKLKPFSFSAKTNFFGENVILTYDKSQVDSSSYSLELTSMNLGNLSSEVPSPLNQVSLSNIIFNFTKKDKTADIAQDSIVSFSGDINFTPILSVSDDSALNVLPNSPIEFAAIYSRLNGYDLKVSLTDIAIPVVGNLNNGLLEFNKTKPVSGKPVAGKPVAGKPEKNNYNLKLTGEIDFQEANLSLKLNSAYDTKNGFVLSGTVGSSNQPINIDGIDLPPAEMTFEITRKLVKQKKEWTFLLNAVLNLKKFTGFDISTSAQIEFYNGKFGKFSTKEIIESIRPFASVNIPGIEDATLKNSTIDVSVGKNGYNVSIDTDINIFGLNINDVKISIEKTAGKVTTNIPFNGIKDLTLKSIVHDLPNFLNIISLNDCAIKILDVSGQNTVSIVGDVDFTIPVLNQKITLQMDLKAYKKNGQAMFDIKGTVKENIPVANGMSIYNINFSYNRSTKELVFSGDLDLSALGIDTSNKAKIVIKDGTMTFSYDATIASLDFNGFGVNDISIKYDDGFILSGQAEIFGQNIPGNIELIETFDVASKNKSKASALKPIVLVNMPLAGELAKIPGLSWIDKIVKNATFVLASQDYQDEKINVKKGLNLAGKIDFSGKLSSVSSFLNLKDLVVNASIPLDLKGFVLNIVIDSNNNINTSKVIQFGDVVLQLSESGTGELGIGVALKLYFSPSGNANNPIPFTGALTFITDPIPSIQGEFVMGRTWQDPFGLKKVAIGPAGAFIGIEPETVPPLPTSFGIMGNMAIGNMLGSIEVIIDLNNLLLGCGFKVNLQDMDLPDFISIVGDMAGLNLPQLPSGLGGLKKLYMSYGPPGGLEFKDTQANSSSKSALASKYSNGNTSFSGLSTLSGTIPSGLYFNADWSVIPAILEADVCMVLNLLKPMDGLVAMASVQLSDWVKKDLASIIQLTDYEDGTFEKFAQAHGVDMASISEKLKDLPCTSNLLNGPRMILVINPTLRLFKIAGGVKLFGGLIAGDIFVEFFEDNSSSAIPTIDFMIKAPIADLLEFEIRMMEAAGSMSLEAKCASENEKLAQWTKAGIDELEKALKEAAIFMDQASNEISKAESTVKAVFVDAQNAVDEMKSAESALQDAISTVNSTLTDADKAALEALNSIGSAVNYCQNQVSNLESDLSSPSAMDILELKPAAWAIELAVFEIAQESLGGIESEAKAIVNGALKTAKITVDEVLTAATDVLSEINKAIDGLLSLIKNLVLAELDAAKAVTKAAGDVMNDLMQPLLNVIEEAVSELLLNILNIKEISFNMPDVSNGNMDFIFKAKLFEQDIDLDLKFNIQDLKGVFEDLGDKIKSGITDAVNDLVTELW